jgi:hypothetical protein
VGAGRCLQAAPDRSEAAADNDGMRVQQVDEKRDAVPGGVSGLVNHLRRERV